MGMPRTPAVLLLLLSLLAFAPPAARAQGGGFVVVAHPAVPLAGVSAAELRRVFLKKQTHWSDGSPVAVVEMSGDPAARAAFYTRVLDSTVERMTTYWINETMTHGVAPPRMYGSAGMLLDYVARTPGAVGFVPAGVALPQGVQHLRLDAPP